MNLTCTLYLPGTVGKGAGEEQVKGSYFFYLAPHIVQSVLRIALNCIGWLWVLVAWFLPCRRNM